MNKAYSNPDNHQKGAWKSTPLHAKSGSENGKNFKYTFKNGVVWTPPVGTYPRFSKETLEKLDKNDEIYFGKNGDAVPSRKTFLSELKNNGIKSNTLWRFDEVGHNHQAKEEIKNILGNSIFDTPKPEKLIQRVIQLGSNEGELVLDFFMGSATTQAVAHKMNRRYIGIEQMDYIETVSVERLKKVIAGEQDGISKDVSWQGGGSFVYCELKNDAQDFKNQILEATSTEVLSELFEQAKESSFLSYRVDPKKLKKQEFEKLSLAEQKQVLLELVDNNNLYVNYSEIDDSDYGITEQDKKLNRQFYGEE
ncbi:Type III restriction-modification system methylation subunit [Streptococcus oralis]|uniref:Methyltransferase n=2 Tax=Streptococcus oralis TaxID=1303 RepID=A0A139PB66_STROR|nr:Type III restriction-modification system methylation subunit [Streptococcus oralis]